MTSSRITRRSAPAPSGGLPSRARTPLVASLRCSNPLRNAGNRRTRSST